MTYDELRQEFIKESFRNKNTNIILVNGFLAVINTILYTR